MGRIPSLTLAILASHLTAAEASASVEFFERKVRPLLAEHCVGCHGSEQQKGRLRLDTPAAIRAGGEGGAILVPGQPEKSRLILAVGYQDEQLKMPPKKRLSLPQVADLSEWVKRGAPMPAGEAPTPVATRKEFQLTDQDRAHWAFQPVKRPEVPEGNIQYSVFSVQSPGSGSVSAAKSARSTNPIDAFILARLQAKGLAPNLPATQLELIRRAYYDLTGLPPSPGDVDSFLADTAPDAWERLVDRLLASPRYGEKWGRHWLDLVRFGESNSYEGDGRKPGAWRYRDYVIRSLNADKPYDLFLREQLAGDEFPGAGAEGFARPDSDALIATGYYRLGVWNDEVTDPEQARYDGLDDIVTTTGQALLGLTVDCARCHDHKTDPIPQRDYYRLLAFFHNITPFRGGGPTDEINVFASPAERLAHEQRDHERETRRLEARRTLAEVAEVERVFRTRLVRGETAKPASLVESEYHYYRAVGKEWPDFDRLKPERSGRVLGGQFDLGLRRADKDFGLVFAGVLLVPQAGSHTFFLTAGGEVRLRVDGRDILRCDGSGPEQKAVVHLPQGRLPIQLAYHQTGLGPRLEVTWAGPGFGRAALSAAEPAREQLDKLMRTQWKSLLPAQGRRVLGEELFARYEGWARQLAELKTVAAPVDPALIAPVQTALIVTEAGTNAPETFVFARGNPSLRELRVEPGYPEVLQLPPPRLPASTAGTTTSGRRTVLAEWITSPENPLTARVMANRVWQHHFGRGIVRSPNNLGPQGDPPTHPELLEWLASEFMAHGWRLKPLHRLIMTSHAYRMSSRTRAEAHSADPRNDWFGRFDSRRLTAEEIRDSILAASGALNLKMSGPGIYVDIPPEVLAGQSRPGDGWGKSPAVEQARRSIYIHVKRSLLVPLLEAFDVAETDRSAPVRFATVQPTQALSLFNGDFSHQQAQVMARRLRREAGADPAQQVRLGLYLALARPPDDAEVQRGVTLVQALESRDRLTAEAALQCFCLVVLNLNEMVYLD